MQYCNPVKDTLHNNVVVGCMCSPMTANMRVLVKVSVKGQLDQISPQPKELHRLGQANEDVTVSRTISDHYVAATSCSYTI